MPRFYVILELSRITRSRTAILMFLDAFQRFHKREREKKEEGNAIIYVEEEKERESLRKRVENSYVRGGQRSDGRKVVENKVIIFFSGRRRAISWTRTRGIDGCFRKVGKLTGETFDGRISKVLTGDVGARCS